RCSDALHERLTERFVERVGDAPVRASGRRRPIRRVAGVVRVDRDHPFRSLAELLTEVAEPAAAAAWVEGVVDAAHGEIEIDDAGRLHHEGRSLGRWRKGPDLLRPE